MVSGVDFISRTNLALRSLRVSLYSAVAYFSVICCFHYFGTWITEIHQPEIAQKRAGNCGQPTAGFINKTVLEQLGLMVHVFSKAMFGLQCQG